MNNLDCGLKAELSETVTTTLGISDRLHENCWQEHKEPWLRLKAVQVPIPTVSVVMYFAATQDDLFIDNDCATASKNNFYCRTQFLKTNSTCRWKLILFKKISVKIVTDVTGKDLIITRLNNFHPMPENNHSFDCCSLMSWVDSHIWHNSFVYMLWDCSPYTKKLNLFTSTPSALCMSSWLM